jgi:CO/xanthine dehydrogenase FAD-binding subunit
MLSNTIQWYFPTKIREAAKLIQKDGIILHGGGTKILEPQPRSSIKGLVDISALGLSYIKVTGNTVHIGSGATFADVVTWSRDKKRMAVLSTSLSHAASTPLRNRITIGGSLKDFPMWSNLYAPLLALDAKIDIIGERSGIFSLEEYATSALIKSKHLVREIRVVERHNIRSGVKIFHVVRFEYPIFTIAAACTMDKNIVRDARIFVTGVKKKLTRLVAAERVLRRNAISDELIDSTVDQVSLTFVPDYKFSAAYKEKVAKVYFKDLLQEIKKSIR